MIFKNTSLIVVAEVNVKAPPDETWEAGPLEPGSDQSGAYDKHGFNNPWERGRYFHERIADALHTPRTRWHRFLQTGNAPVLAVGLRAASVELLRLRNVADGRAALLIVHCETEAEGDQLVEAIRAVRNPDQDVRDWLQACVGSIADVDVAAPPVTVCFTSCSESLPEPAWGDSEWTTTQKWLSLLATGKTWSLFPRALPQSGEVALSSRWSMLVLAEGAAFVVHAWETDEDVRSIYRQFVSSVYLDALLLGVIQRRTLISIADSLSHLEDPAHSLLDQSQLLDLEYRFTWFRNALWWTHIAPRGFTNRILRDYQQKTFLGELVDQISLELGDYSRQVQTAAAQRSGALIALVTIVGLPFGLAVGLLQIRYPAAPDWRTIFVYLGGAGALSLVLLLTPPGRLSVRGLMRVRRRTEPAWLDSAPQLPRRPIVSLRRRWSRNVKGSRSVSLSSLRSVSEPDEGR